MFSYFISKPGPDYEINDDAFEGAVLSDSPHILRFLFEKKPASISNFNFKEQLYQLALSSNSVGCFKVLRDLGCEWDPRDFAIVLAAFGKRKSLDLVRLVAPKEPLGKDTKILAISVSFAPNFDLLTFLVKARLVSTTPDILDYLKLVINPQHVNALLATWEILVERTFQS